MDHAERGAKALEASEVSSALISYTKALIEHPTSPDFFIQRSIAFSKLKPPRYDLALQDAEYAVLCGQSRGRRNKIQAGQHRRMVAFYNMERYGDAKLILDSMIRWRPKQEGKLTKKEQMEHDIWSTKIDGKLKKGPQQPTIQEYPQFTLPDQNEVKKMLQAQLNPDGSFNYEGTADTVASAKEHGEISQPTETTAPASQKIRHEWYQNNQQVIVTIYAKGVPKDKTEVILEDDSVTISFPHPSNPVSSFEFTLDPLFAFIDPSKSKFQVMSTKIELTLAKIAVGQKWANLEGSEPLKQSDKRTKDIPQTNMPSQAPAYPTSSKSGPKNWDKLASDLTKKKDKKDGSDDGEDSDYGGDAVDGFFKKLYAGSDDATRRAMMKSFTESNGTALSTNWSDVGSRFVEPVKSKDEE